VVGGDLNLTMSRIYIWGDFARLDRLVDYFRTQFDLVGWVDLEPIKIRPNWVNNMVGNVVVAK
jgi:hypothetical protein